MGLSALAELVLGEIRCRSFAALSPAERRRISEILSWAAYEVAPKAQVLPFKGVLEDLKNRQTE